jgi:hypothetical protein
MKKKAKCYEGGGDVYEDNAPYKSDDQGAEPTPLKQSALFTKMGENDSISKLDKLDGIRERAMKAVAEGGQKDEPVAKKVTRVAKKVSPKAKSVEVEKVTTERFNPSKMAGIDTSRFRKPPAGAMAAMGFKSGGKVSSASKRADGCAIRGKTRA